MAECLCSRGAIYFPAISRGTWEALGDEPDMATRSRSHILPVLWVLQEEAKVGCAWMGQSWLRA